MKDFESSIVQAVKNCPRTLKLTIISTFVFGLLTHMFIYANPILVGDSIAIYQNTISLPSLASGRGLGMLMQAMMGGLTLPWLAGLITMSLMSISAYLVCETLEIKRTVPIIMVAALMISYPSIIASHAYTSSVFVYAASLCFAAAAAWQIKKDTWAGYGFGVLLMLLSLSCYQAYVSFTACLLVLVMLKKLLSESDFSFKVWWTIIKMIIVFVIAVFIYYFATILFNALIGSSFGAAGYSGQEYVGDFSHLGFGSLLKATYSLPFKYFLSLPYPTYLPLPILVLFWMGMVAAIIQVTRKLRQKGKYQVWRIITFIGAGLFLPFTMNLVKMFDMGHMTYPHALMTFAFITPWILLIMINEVAGAENQIKPQEPNHGKLNQYLSWILLTPVIIFSLFGCYSANVSYMKMNVNYESGMAIMNRIVSRIESTPGYQPNETEVVLVGLPATNAFGYDVNGGFDITDNITGVEPGVFWSNHTVETYIQQELQTPMKLGSHQQYANSDEVAAISAYPSTECIIWIDDVLVCKLGGY